MKSDSEDVYDFVLNNLHLGSLRVNEEDIIIFGKSIGTGVSMHLAAVRSPKVLIACSSFSTIMNILKD